MNIDEIRELIELAKQTGIASLDVQRGDHRVRIRLTAGNATPITAPAQNPAVEADAAAMGATAPAPTAAPEVSAEPAHDPNLVLVRSPIVGTFYEGPSPDASPFVRIGERVQPGKVLCIIESMKLMNEIEAEIAGIIESKLVLNGQPVEYGEALFAIRSV